MADDDVVYRVDDRDVIVFVNDAWDRFAQANGGEGVISSRILQRSLWDFIADATTQEIYRQILQRARSGHAIHFTFRCDAPQYRRLLRMDVHRGEDDTVEFRTHTLAEEPRQPIFLESAHPGYDGELLRVCGWCKKVFVEGSWEEIEVAIERLQIFERPRPPLMSHGICDACYQSMLEVLAES